MTNEEIFDRLQFVWNNPPENLLTMGEKFDYLDSAFPVKDGFFLTLWQECDNRPKAKMVTVTFYDDNKNESNKIIALAW